MNTHPLRLDVTDDLSRSRLTVFFRWLLAIPHLIWVSLWGIAAFFAAIVNWFATLFAGRSPEALHNFLVSYTRYVTQLTAYLHLLADPYPGFGGAPGYPVDLVVDPPEAQNRWKTLFRCILAIPALILAYVLSAVLSVIAFLAWFVCLVIGRMPEGMRNLGTFCLRYEIQTLAYAYFILTDRYPSLGGETEGTTAENPY
jgi:hypothetical protein